MPWSLNILVADRNYTQRLILKAILQQFGHQVTCADNKQEVLDALSSDTFQLICMDIHLELESTWDFVETINAQLKDYFIPILMITDAPTPIDLTNSLKKGGADFIVKPYVPAFVGAKLNSISKLISLHKIQQRQSNQLLDLNNLLQKDQEVAKIVYEKITHSNCLSDSCFKTLQYGHHTFNGDVILAAPKPNGGMHILLGDFTGHGLSAAIGAIPLADIFFDWTQKGFVMPQIIFAINAKLKSVLPVNMFCSAVTIDINLTDKTIEVWNGGIPAVLFFSKESSVPKLLKSQNLPLGVLTEHEFTYSAEILNFCEGDSIFAWSDGIHEAQTIKGDFFCNTHLDRILQGEIEPDQLLIWIDQTLRQEGVLDTDFDDISCLGIDLSYTIGRQMKENVPVNQHYAVDTDFAFKYRLEAPSLKSTDPLPYVLQIIMTVPGLRNYSGQIFMLLSEAFSNALEHGVLKLNSELKQTHKGFADYFIERESRLNNLEHGYVDFSIKIMSEKGQGKLFISVEDSGDGFDIMTFPEKVMEVDTPYNRGLALIKQLSYRVDLSPKGNQIDIEFRWNDD